MQDALRDIVKHTHGLGFIEMVKLIGSATEAKIETIDGDKSVVIYGDMYQPIKDIDSTVGLSRLAVLKGFMDLHDKSTVEITTEARANTIVPTEVKFDNGAGFTSNYRFMSETMINENVKVPPFKGAVWNVTITPGKKDIDLLSKIQGNLGGFEKRFTVSVDAKGTLNFSVGSGPTDRSVVPFAKNVTGTLKHQWSWPLTQVLAILKLAEQAASATMYFSDMGALKIEIDSGIGKYSYILPAGKA
jgi:hypothetical protein